MARPSRSVVLPALAAVFALFVALPVLGLFTNLPWSQLWAALGNTGTADAVATSLLSTTTSTCLVTMFGVPLAYVLARCTFPGRGLIGALVYLPLVLPPIVAGILLLLVWGQTGSVEQFLQPHGIYFVGEISGIVLAQMFVSGPFVVIAARSAFERIESDLEEAAITMGADTLRIFWSIAVPLSIRAILAGAALSWMRSFGEFGATVIMAYHPYSFPVYLWVQFGSVGFGPVLPLALLAIILAAAVLAVVALLERVGAVAAVMSRLAR